MSATLTPPAPAAPAAGPTPTVSSPQEIANDSLKSPQFILACVTYAIVACTVGAILYHGDDGNIKLVLGFVFGLGSGAGGFYFGSSKSSQAKDATLAAQLPNVPIVVPTSNVVPVTK